MVGHPGVAQLVSSRPRHGPSNRIMHGDILPREDRGERSEGVRVLPTPQPSMAKLEIWLWLPPKREFMVLL